MRNKKNILYKIIVMCMCIFFTGCASKLVEVEEDTHEYPTLQNAANNISRLESFPPDPNILDEAPPSEQSMINTPTITNVASQPITTIPLTQTTQTPTTTAQAISPSTPTPTPTPTPPPVPPTTTPSQPLTSKKTEASIAPNKKEEKQKSSKSTNKAVNTESKKSATKKEAAKKKKTTSSKGRKVEAISSFSTKFNAGNKDRVHNLKRAASKINGVVVNPGEVFSFNSNVGPTGARNGFKRATVLRNGKEFKGYGGGVCQVSTTVYNAAKKAGMKIVERHNHSKEVPYVAQGSDAAVSYGVIDFRFKNTQDYPVKVSVSVKGSNCYAAIGKIL